MSKLGQGLKVTCLVLFFPIFLRQPVEDWGNKDLDRETGKDRERAGETSGWRKKVIRRKRGERRATGRLRELAMEGRNQAPTVGMLLVHVYLPALARYERRVTHVALVPLLPVLSHAVLLQFL